LQALIDPPARRPSLLSRLTGNRYVANLAKLSLSSTLAQVLSFVTVPIILRLYQPADYGVAATYTAVVAVLGTAACLRYDVPVVLAETEAEAAALLKLALWLAFGFSLATLPVFWLIRLWAPWPAVSQLGGLILVVPLSVMGSATAAVLGYWTNRRGEYTRLAVSRVAGGLTYAGIAIASALVLGSTPIGLVAGTIGTSLVTIGILLGSRPGRLEAGVAPAPLRAVARRFRQFPMFNLGMNLLDTFTASLPLFLFTSLFSPSAAAYFALANNVLRLPLGIISQSVGQVFVERAAKLQGDPGALFRFMLTNARNLALVALIPFLLLMIGGPWLFSLVFGHRWYEAGSLARWLALSMALTFVVSPISSVPSIINRQNVHFALSIVGFGARVAGLVLGARLGSPEFAVGGYSLGESLSLVVLLGWLYRYFAKAAPQAAP